MSRLSPTSGSARTALGGILAAGSLVLLWLACLAPSGRIGLIAVAGLFPVVGVLAGGQVTGYLCWASAGLLGLILLPDKGVALLYLAFLGLYPVVKSRIESLRRQPVEWLFKLVFFNAVLTVFWFLMQGLFLPNPPAWLLDNSLALYLAGNVVFILYDVGLSRLIALLQARLRRRTR
ncbi:MAG: hypothetical protein AB7E30_01270 [Lawsonibacter sp.]